jgi:hypothetical protein
MNMTEAKTATKPKAKRRSRVKEPSTWAGFALLAQGIAALVATKGLAPEGWAAVVGGAAAVLAREMPPSPQPEKVAG